jgi:hypothetical protein
MVILIVIEAFAIWFWSIVFRAYRYMREVLRGPSLGDNYEYLAFNNSFIVKYI